jgi:2C-methyl-D-erythritol 2,4-cyclodiphosphate synthase
MKQISLPSDNSQNQKKQVQAREKLNIAYFKVFLTIYQYSLLQLSRRQLYHLQISAINLRFACTAITLSSFAISLFLYHYVNNQKLDITNKPQQLPQHQAKLIHSSVAKVNNEAISTIKSATVLNTRKANSHNIVYNVKKPPILSKDNKKLDSIIKELVNLAKKQDFPIGNLSITLIDINQKKISGYQQHIPRYPASVVKLFWMVALEAQINQGLIANNKYVKSDLEGMILKSDNDAASRILDTLTRTKSSHQSSNKNIDWKNRRQQINLFFKTAEYKNINISQKTFPISEPSMIEPEGTDLQLPPNQITTYHAARLMYEIFTKQAISISSSQKMADLLKRDLHPQAWKRNPPNSDEFNPVENLLGESLSQKSVIFASKAGLNSTSRHEVAYVATKDGKVQYIIAVFGKDAAYSESNSIFPDMSKLVFERMTGQK